MPDMEWGLVYIGAGMQLFHTRTISSSPLSIYSSISSFILPSLSQMETSRVLVGDSGSCFDLGNPSPEAKATSTSLHHPGLFHALSDFWRLIEASYVAFCQLSSLLWDQNIVIPFLDFHRDLWGKKIKLLLKRQRFWKEVFPKEIYKWLTGTWKYDWKNY